MTERDAEVSSCVTDGQWPTAGLPWVTIRSDEGVPFFKAIEKAQVDDEIGPFVEFPMASHPPDRGGPRVPEHATYSIGHSA